MCHIPYVFFSAKEAMLIIVDEWDRSSISEKLKQNLLNSNEKREKITYVPKDETMVYHSMNNKYYYGVTLSIYLLELLLAMVVKDLGIVF